MAATLAGTAALAQQAPKPAEPGVASRNRAVLNELPFADRQDFDDAMRGFVATTPDAAAPDRYSFLQGTAPDTVNPSLWRQARLNMNNGLFQVAEGIYQLRGFDLSNLTVVEGDTGLIVIDPLTSAETARAAMEKAGASAKDIAALVTAIEDQHVPAVFTEPQASEESRILRQAAADAVARV